MTPTTNVHNLSETVYGVVMATISGSRDIAAVQLKDGGVIVTSADGDHVSVYVQSCHFEPGEAVPF